VQLLAGHLLGSLRVSVRTLAENTAQSSRLEFLFLAVDISGSMIVLRSLFPADNVDTPPLFFFFFSERFEPAHLLQIGLIFRRIGGEERFLFTPMTVKTASFCSLSFLPPTPRFKADPIVRTSLGSPYVLPLVIFSFDSRL
jgi:hypothetical protein